MINNIKGRMKMIEYKEFGKIKVGNDGSIITRNKGVHFGYNNNGYCNVKIDDKTMKIHRIVAHLFLGLDLNDSSAIIDHINGCKNDNRVLNLRIVSARENNSNKKSHRNGKLVGCYFNKKANKWHSQIKINKKRIHLGYFDTEQLAHEKYTQTLEYILKLTV
jgi:hypothetical protein